MGVITSAHGLRVDASPFPNPHPNRTAATAVVPQPTVVVVSGGSGTPPTVVLVTSPSTTGYAPHAVIAQGFGTTAGSSAITSYSFNWGDGTAVSNTTKTVNGSAVPVPIAYHRYTVAGSYTLQLTVTDANGNSVSATRGIVVTAVPSPTVTINPGTNINGAINGAAAGAIIQVNAGVYVATGSITPKANQVIYANGAVTISGNNTVQYGVTPSTVTGVVIRGIRFTAYTQWAFQFGTVGTGGNVTLKDCELDTNGTNGTVSGAVNGFNGGVIVFDTCHVHHNRSYNIAGGAQSTIIMIGGEYDNGFTDTSGAINPNAGDGVWKHVHSDGDYIVGCNIHDNQGSALWWDGSCVNMYVCLCTVTNNRGPGVFSEINDAAHGGGASGTIGTIVGNLDGSGYSVRWLFNTLSGNGYPATSFFPTGNIYPSNLWVSKSDKIEMAYNWIDGGAHGVTLDYQVGRPEGHNLANIAVHHNDIRLRETGASGFGSGAGRVGFHNSVSGTAYALTNVTFHHNSYYAAHDNGTWQHFIVYTGTSEVNNTFAQWQANGYDTTGSTMSLDTAWPH